MTTFKKKTFNRLVALALCPLLLLSPLSFASAQDGKLYEFSIARFEGEVNISVCDEQSCNDVQMKTLDIKNMLELYHREEEVRTNLGNILFIAGGLNLIRYGKYLNGILLMAVTALGGVERANTLLKDVEPALAVSMVEDVLRWRTDIFGHNIIEYVGASGSLYGVILVLDEVEVATLLAGLKILSDNYEAYKIQQEKSLIDHIGIAP